MGCRSTVYNSPIYNSQNAKIWNQPRCSSTSEWIMKMWCIYKMEYHLAQRRMKLYHFQEKWMELEIIMLSDISQIEKVKYLKVSLICGI
jgi:hypothetical protein